MKKLLVYVHIPFCTAKCHFCDWVQEIPVSSLRLKSESSQRIGYIKSIKEQIHYFGPRLADQGYVPAILYWGGGTASILTHSEIYAITSALEDEFDLAGVNESTIECSPETLTREKLTIFRDVGFRRISIGIQSFQSDRLRRIGRAHDAEEAIRSVCTAAEVGFSDINIDLICGFPDETLKEVELSIRKVQELPVNHVSLYPFRPTHGTVMYRHLGSGAYGNVRLEEQLEAYDLGRALLEDAGLKEYALSHFGHPQCRSDMAYFKLEMDWIGFGSGATSLLDHRFLSTERGMLARYISRPREHDEDLPAASPQITPRLIYQALSTPDGVIGSLWMERTGVALEEILKQDSVHGLLKYVDKISGVILDERGVRLPKKVIARTFINLQFFKAPPGAREMSGVRSVFGGY